MYDFSNFINNKSALKKKMLSVKEKISELEKLGIDVSETLGKIDNAIRILSEDKISVVLVGAFSDGKTSVAAGWLNEQVSNMKIDSDESSDEILCYTPSMFPEDCRIVDTPGLFGDKIGADENGAKIALSDITRKYISEANLILYVVTAKNPIKDSHKECVRWILKDLNKLTSTIFVINRMDDVADLTDDDDFNMQARIKTENLREKLLECGLTSAEAAQVRVACISAAPNGKSIEAWAEYREEYLHRSHLNELEKLINDVLKDCGTSLIVKTGCDILNVEINTILKEIERQQEQIEKYQLPEIEETLRRNKKDLESLRKKILRSKHDIKKELSTLKKKKIGKVRDATMEDFKDVLEDEIGITPGKEGKVLESEINEIINKYHDSFSDWSIKLDEKFQAEYEKQNQAVENLIKNGANGAAHALKGVKYVKVDAIKAAIFGGRNALKKVGIVIKFKPWQAVKLAKFANTALPVIGAAIDITVEVAEKVTAERRNKIFQQSKEEVKNKINAAFFDVEDQFGSEESFIEQFAPEYIELEKQLKQYEQNMKELKNLLKQYRLWYDFLSSDDISID